MKEDEYINLDGDCYVMKDYDTEMNAINPNKYTKDDIAL